MVGGWAVMGHPVPDRQVERAFYPDATVMTSTFP